MTNILLLEDLPEIRAWLSNLVLQVFPGAHISEAPACTMRWGSCQPSSSIWP